MATKSKKAKKAAKPKAAAAPVSQSVRRLNFRTARVVKTKPGHYKLIVAGTKPCANMQVHLSPLIYVQQPVYWGIEVVGVLAGICLPVVKPYQVSISLDGIIGKKGIEVIGATRKKKINVP